MAEPTSHAARLTNLLAREREALTRLVELLEEETRALAAMDLESIESLNDAKRPILATLESLGPERTALLHDSGEHDADAIIAACADAGELRRAAREVGELAARCRELGRIGAAQVRKCQRYLGDALTILLGTEPVSGYDARGTASTERHSRPITAA